MAQHFGSECETTKTPNSLTRGLAVIVRLSDLINEALDQPRRRRPRRLIDAVGHQHLLPSFSPYPPHTGHIDSGCACTLMMRNYSP